MSDTDAQTIPYVRDSMLPQAAPPTTERGVVKWVRENLVSSWVNAILTIISLYIVYWVVSHLWGWFANSVWDASSLTNCREILEGDTLVCFGKQMTLEALVPPKKPKKTKKAKAD